MIDNMHMYNEARLRSPQEIVLGWTVYQVDGGGQMCVRCGPVDILSKAGRLEVMRDRCLLIQAEVAVFGVLKEVAVER